ncbi:hypothetical protein Nepgr_025025 [Nepenthes gracilis]|uniref:Uncharacterized protein n=1 Tax=Nepenthes gracilis TaxID=150966 RepID=A0AAD3T5Q9_NEPGR|nr:hypothetical protein Nepgr_025025 [Nepenthes gracilis]
MEGLREQGDEYNEDAAVEREVVERADIEGDMVSEAKGGIIGAIVEAIKRKLTMPNEEDVSDEGKEGDG